MNTYPNTPDPIYRMKQHGHNTPDNYCKLQIINVNIKLFQMKNFLILVIGLISIVLLNTCSSREKIPWEFEAAVPVWPVGLEYEKNLTVGYMAHFDSPASGTVLLKLTGSSLYRIYLNGKFVGHGPARAGHGFYRVDEWDLSGDLNSGENYLAIEVAGYNINSYYLLDQPSFLQAEVVSGNKTLVATSDSHDDFVAIQMNERIQKDRKSVV